MVCPADAIAFGRDDDGFYAPEVDADKCTQCGVCTEVCYKYLAPAQPFVNTFEGKPLYGAWSSDVETVRASSSGGVGYELTAHFLAQGYKICGCVFDAVNDECKHIIAENEVDLEAIRSSKYLQSYTPAAFSQLAKDGKYLVVGTPCQIYGVRKWVEMMRWEERFVLVDFFCHGTPSFNLWKKYKEHLRDRHGLGKSLRSVNFREKGTGWHTYAMSVSDSAGAKYVREKAAGRDLFFRFFLRDTCLSASCYECRLRLDHCASDIRIADFWGTKYADNQRGVSLVITNTEKGARAFEAIKPALVAEKCTFADLRGSQGVRWLKLNDKRAAILNELRGTEPLGRIYSRHYSRLRRVAARLKKMVR